MLNPIELDLLKLHEAGARALAEYASRKFIQTNIQEIDEVLEGGIESGNFYLFLGPAKSGKSLFLRTLGISLAKNTPVLYCNFEQLGSNTFSTIYKMYYGSSLQEGIKEDLEVVNSNIQKLPEVPFYIAFWPDKLDNKAFNIDVSKMLETSIVEIAKKHDGQKPIVVFENLSDVYNERIGRNDNLVNVVTQTAQDIKNFCIKHEVTVFLAHHTGKIQGDEPTLDDVRDSKRVVDLAHSIFCSYIRSYELEENGYKVKKDDYLLAYLGGRSMTSKRTWNVEIGVGSKFTLTPYLGIPVQSKMKK